MLIALNINTADKDKISLALENSGKIISALEIKARFKQAECLLTGIDKLIKKNRLNLKDIKNIKVADSGDSFTSLRIGVVTANALAYALNIGIDNILSKNRDKSAHKIFDSINIIKPKYGAKPNIKIRKNMI